MIEGLLQRLKEANSFSLRPTDEVTKNALVESLALHLRAVSDFLFSGNRERGDDYLAWHHFDSKAEWEAKAGKKPGLISSLHTRAGKEIAHLTYKRLTQKEGREDLRFYEYSEALRPPIKAFFDSAVAPGVCDCTACKNLKSQLRVAGWI